MLVPASAQPASPGGSSWITSCTVGAFLDVCRREALRTGPCLPRGCSGLGPVRPAQDHIPTVLSLQVSNGPGPGDERTTSLLLLGFLQSCPHSCFQRELEALGHELPGHLFHDDELQTDGNRCSHFPLAAEAETGRHWPASSALGPSGSAPHVQWNRPLGV